MKIRKTSKKTPKPWELDLGLVLGKRKREFFESEPEAKAAMAEKLEQLKLDGENSLAINTKLRLRWIEAEKRCAEWGITVAGLLNFYELHHTKLKPIALTEAIALCVAAKVTSGKRKVYTDALRRSMDSLAKACPGETTASITQSQIEQWARTGKDGKVSLATVRSRLIDAKTLFNFCLKRKLILESPCNGIEPVKLEEKPPGIHTVEEVKQLLACALEHDPALLGYLCPLYFGGLRPAEAKKLIQAEIHDDYLEVQGPKGKSRRRRFASINPTLDAWLEVPGVTPGMSPRSRRLDKLRWILGGRKMRKNSKGRNVRVVVGFPWPHDVLRHSFCSYSMEAFGAAATAKSAGHSEAILFAHYRERVKPDDAKAYWALRPETVKADKPS
jgi:site-specific recombinase XerC